MNTDQIVEKCKRHTLYAWSARNAAKPLPIAKAEGVYFYDTDGKRYLDCIDGEHSRSINSDILIKF